MKKIVILLAVVVFFGLSFSAFAEGVAAVEKAKAATVKKLAAKARELQSKGWKNVHLQREKGSKKTSTSHLYGTEIPEVWFGDGCQDGKYFKTVEAITPFLSAKMETYFQGKWAGRAEPEKITIPAAKRAPAASLRKFGNAYFDEILDLHKKENGELEVVFYKAGRPAYHFYEDVETPFFMAGSVDSSCNSGMIRVTYIVNPLYGFSINAGMNVQVSFDYIGQTYSGTIQEGIFGDNLGFVVEYTQNEMESILRTQGYEGTQNTFTISGQNYEATVWYWNDCSE